MKSISLLVSVLVTLALSGCGGGGGGTTSSSSSTSSNTTSVSTFSGNVLTITVNGSLCSSSTSSSYPNKPCVSVTICNPGTATCQTVNDILLDTGSYGLRIFGSVLTSVSPTQVANGSGSLAECVQFGDGSSLWGPVKMADVVMGGEPAVQVPIQVIDASFGTAPIACQSADATPIAAGFNGILGVGLHDYDCGTFCTLASNGMYYSCTGASCTATTAPLADQVRNPVALLPLDNNGVIVKLPALGTGGATSVTGSLILGIGTRANNIPSGVTSYPADQYARFKTTFDGITYASSFLDTGSNGLFFPAPSSGSLPACSSPNAGWYCPPTTINLSAITTGVTGSPSNTINFMIANANSLFLTSNSVFSELGGTYTGGFDWGLPFFLGRDVYVGMANKTSSLGTGPYWAY